MESTEAKSSVTYSVTSKDGFNILFTVRDDKASDLLDKMAIIEPSLIKRGYVPQKKSFGGGGEKKPIEYVEGEVCPLCKEKLVKATTKDGKNFIKCSTQKYDFATKTTSGCKYVKWLD